MLSEEKFYLIHNDYDVIITNMNEKLYTYKLKNPSFDISESLKTINTLRFLQDTFHKQHHVILTLEGQHGNWSSERKRLMDKIIQLEKENVNLKENLSL